MRRVHVHGFGCIWMERRYVIGEFTMTAFAG